ncbi:MAG: thioesterase family protein [Dehalococcoidia bacterium]
MSSMSEEDARLSREMGLQGRYPPFVDLLGVTFEPLDGDNICIKLAMRDELALGSQQGSLHGGVISSMMDIIGGTVVAWELKNAVKDQPLHEQARKLSGVRTVDLRVDYLRPGKGKNFTATASILRTGKKVAVTRMELHNEEQHLIAVGTGTYTVG